MVGVVGCKAYSLRSKRGLSDKFDPEVERAKAKGLSLLIAIKNKLNGLEKFQVFQPEDLDCFTCSAPLWIAGEKASEEDRGEQKKAGACSGVLSATSLKKGIYSELCDEHYEKP